MTDKKYDDGIGVMPDGEIEQYPPGMPIPPKPIKVIDDDGSVSYETLPGEDDALFENDDDLELDDDDED